MAQVNGEAVYGTRPWSAPTTTSEQGVEIRFTRGHDAGFATFIGDVADRHFEMPEIRFDPDRAPELLGYECHADFVNTRHGLAIRFHADLPSSEAYVVRISPMTHPNIIYILADDMGYGDVRP